MTTQILDDSAALTPTQCEVHYLGKDHEMSPQCWCFPRLEFKDPKTGNEIWVHHQPN